MCGALFHLPTYVEIPYEKVSWMKTEGNHENVKEKNKNRECAVTIGTRHFHVAEDFQNKSQAMWGLIVFQ